MKNGIIVLLIVLLPWLANAQVTFTASNAGITTTTGRSTSFTHSWADFDNDDRWDLFLARGDYGFGQTPQVYRNTGNGIFQDITSTSFPTFDAGYYAHMCFGDFDNDGFVDVFQDAFVSSKNKLWRNNGNLTFSDVTDLMKIKNPGRSTTGTFWFDYDKDGFLDLLVNAQDGQGTSVYHNAGGDSLIKDTIIANTQKGDLAFATDINQDGYIDVYLANHLAPDLFFLGSKNGFTSFDGSFLNQLFPNTSNRTNGCFADIDNDGYPDMMLGDASHVVIWHNDSGKTFHNWTPELKLDSLKKCERMSFIQDFDNDGYLDLLMYNNTDSSQLWYGGQKGFSKSVLPLHFAVDTVPSSVSWTDYDNDGFLDIMEAGQGTTVLWHNEGNVNRWLSVKLRGHRANSMGIGSEVIAYYRSISQYRDVGFNQGYYGYQPAMAHFGFGPPGCESSDVIDSVVIVWQPGGRQVLRNVMMNQYIVVDQDSGIVRAYTHPIAINYIGYVYPYFSPSQEVVQQTRCTIPVTIYVPDSLKGHHPTELTFGLEYNGDILDIPTRKVAQHFTAPTGWQYKSSSVSQDLLLITITNTSDAMLGNTLYLGNISFDTYYESPYATSIKLSQLSMIDSGIQKTMCIPSEGSLITSITIDSVQSSVVQTHDLLSNRLVITPNPSSGEAISIECSSSEHQQLRIYDMLGRVVYTDNSVPGQLSAYHSKYMVTSSGLAPGSYVVEVAGDAGLQTGRLQILK